MSTRGPPQPPSASSWVIARKSQNKLRVNAFVISGPCGFSENLAFELFKTFEIEDRDATVLGTHQPRHLEQLERVIHALAREAGEVADLFLRDVEHRPDAGREMRIEQAREAARHACVRR